MVPRSVGVDDEAREGAVFVGVATMHLPAVQFYEDLVAHIQVQNDAVAGIVVVLVRILSNGAGSDLSRKERKTTYSSSVQSCNVLGSDPVDVAWPRKAAEGQWAVGVRRTRVGHRWTGSSGSAIH